MPERPPEAPLDVQQENAKNAFEKLRALMVGGSGSYHEFQNEIGVELKNLGVNPEVAWVMMANRTTDETKISETTEIEKGEIAKNIRRLEELGILSEPIAPDTSPQLNMTVEDEMDKVVQLAERMKNKNRAEKFSKELPAGPEKAVEGYVLLQKTLAPSREDSQIQEIKHKLETLAACRFAIKIEWDEIIKQLADKSKEAQAKKMIDGILNKIDTARSVLVAQAKKKLAEGAGFDQKLKEFEDKSESELSNLETSALLRIEHNQNRVLTPEDGILSPLMEYRLMKEVENEWMVQAIEEVRAKKSNGPEPKKNPAKGGANPKNVIKKETKDKKADKGQTAPKPTVETDEEDGVGKSEEMKEVEALDEKESISIPDAKAGQPKDKPKEMGPEEKKEVARPQTLEEKMVDFIVSVKNRGEKGPAAQRAPRTKATSGPEKDVAQLEEEMISEFKQPKAKEGAKPLREKRAELAKDTRKKLKQVLLAGLLALGVVPLGYVGQKVSGYSPSVGSVSLNMPNWSSDTFKPEIEEFSEEEHEELVHLQAEGKATKERDEFTNNYLDPKLEKEIIKEPLVKKEVHGKMVTGKRSVVERFAAAWEVLGKHDILFGGNNCDFSTNKSQYRILRDIPPDVPGYGGPMTLGFHVAGQAFDVGNMKMVTTSSEGEKIQRVMTAFGFRWGVETANVSAKSRIKALFSDAFVNGFEVFKGEKDGEEAWNELRKNSLKEGAVKIDRVHFEMRASDLKNADSISDAKEKAEAIFQKVAEKKKK
jgi:hypothetical protein